MIISPARTGDANSGLVKLAPEGRGGFARCRFSWWPFVIGTLMILLLIGVWTPLEARGVMGALGTSGKRDRVAVLDGLDETPISFVTFYYSRRTDRRNRWRENPSKLITEANDRMLQAYGGITVLTTPEAEETVKNWNVSRHVVIKGVQGKCAKSRPESVEHDLCPKRIIMAASEFLDLKHVVFLDADARIVSPEFMEKIKYYRHFADFVASPAHVSWDCVKYYKSDEEFNSGVFYLRTEALNRTQFVHHMENACHKLTHQRCLSSYMSQHADELHIVFLPWTMHCRAKYVSKGCLLLHHWLAGAKGLDWTLNESNWKKYLASYYGSKKA